MLQLLRHLIKVLLDDDRRPSSVDFPTTEGRAPTAAAPGSLISSRPSSGPPWSQAGRISTGRRPPQEAENNGTSPEHRRVARQDAGRPRRAEDRLAPRRVRRRRDRRADVRHRQGGPDGRHLTFVPLAWLTYGPDALQMAVTRQQVKSAPNIELHGDELSRGDESALYHHHELTYTPPDTKSGRRLARR